MNTTAMTACQTKVTSRRSAATTFLLFSMADAPSPNARRFHNVHPRQPAPHNECIKFNGIALIAAHGRHNAAAVHVFVNGRRECANGALSVEPVAQPRPLPTGYSTQYSMLPGRSPRRWQ